MGQPLPLRPDYDAPALRALARRSKDAARSRRLPASAAISARCRPIAALLRKGRTSAAPLPSRGQTAPKMQVEAVRRSCGAEGRLPRGARRRAILFFWPTRASSADQTSTAPGARSCASAMAAGAAGGSFRTPRWRPRPGRGAAAGPRACGGPWRAAPGSASASRPRAGTPPAATGPGRPAAGAPRRGSRASARPRSRPPARRGAPRSAAAAGPAPCGRPCHPAPRR